MILAKPAVLQPILILSLFYDITIITMVKDVKVIYFNTVQVLGL